MTAAGTPFVVLLVALLGGLFFGLFYFVGLWLSVRALPDSRHPALLVGVSFAGRTALTLLGFWAIGGAEFPRWAALLIGFVVARFFVRQWLLRGGFAASQEGLHGSHSN